MTPIILSCPISSLEYKKYPVFYNSYDPYGISVKIVHAADQYSTTEISPVYLDESEVLFTHDVDILYRVIADLIPVLASQYSFHISLICDQYSRPSGAPIQQISPTKLDTEPVSMRDLTASSTEG